MGSEVLDHESFKLFHHPAKQKKHAETILLIHHMGGSHRTTNRHSRYFNRLGYDCVSFDLLLGTNLKNLFLHPLLKKGTKGVFTIWTKQIEEILNKVPGPKIICSFSGPSLSALVAAAPRTDIVKVICDGGPFTNIYENSRHVFDLEMNVTHPLLNSTLAFVATVVWGYRPLRKLHKALEAWSPNVPILSIRGLKDPIVTIESIRSVFRPHPNLPLMVLEIDEGTHLNGLRDHRDLYTQIVTKFLS